MRNVALLMFNSLAQTANDTPIGVRLPESLRDEPFEDVTERLNRLMSLYEDENSDLHIRWTRNNSHEVWVLLLSLPGAAAALIEEHVKLLSLRIRRTLNIDVMECERNTQDILGVCRNTP
jgi:hypothetical protein